MVLEGIRKFCYIFQFAEYSAEFSLSAPEGVIKILQTWREQFNDKHLFVEAFTISINNYGEGGGQQYRYVIIMARGTLWLEETIAVGIKKAIEQYVN